MTERTSSTIQMYSPCANAARKQQHFQRFSTMCELMGGEYAAKHLSQQSAHTAEEKHLHSHLHQPLDIQKHLPCLGISA